MNQPEISTPETVLMKAKKTAKFAWRHFFTLAILAILLSVFIEAPLNWQNAFYMVATSLFLDWAKQFIKFTPRLLYTDTPLNTSILPFREQWWDSTLRGTPAHFLENMDNSRYN